MKSLAAKDLFPIVKRMIAESSIDARCHPGGCGIRNCGSPAACDWIEVSGAETCLHWLLLVPGAPAPKTALPATVRVQPGATSNATAATVAHSMDGSRIAQHHTVIARTVKYPAFATETKSSAPP
jgi:hypothetical protein